MKIGFLGTNCYITAPCFKGAQEKNVLNSQAEMCSIGAAQALAANNFYKLETIPEFGEIPSRIFAKMPNG